jgi:hypothetical protein
MNKNRRDFINTKIGKELIEKARKEQDPKVTTVFEVITKIINLSSKILKKIIDSTSKV